MYILSITLLTKAGDSPNEYFRKLVKKHKLSLPQNWQSDIPLDQAIALLKASYEKKVDLFTISELQQETVRQVKKLWQDNPGKRVRLKHVEGGGGKGQRIISSLDEIEEAVMTVLIESKSTGVGDNKNFPVSYTHLTLPTKA